MEKDIPSEDMSLKQILLQMAVGAAIGCGFLIAIALFDMFMHWISRC